MLAEALKFLSDQAARASIPTNMPPAGPREIRYAINGGIVAIGTEGPPRKHHPATLDDLIALANRFAGRGAGTSEEPRTPGELDTTGMSATPVVWYDHESVVLVLDDAGHRIDTATLTLQPSDLWRTLIALRKQAPWYSQRDFVRLLKIELAGTLPDGALLDIVRKLKFEAGQVVRSEVLRGKESMGRDVTHAVSAEADIPDQVSLYLPVYSTPGEDDAYPVRCSVEVDPTRAPDAFRLRPLPDELERVQAVAVAGIGERLRVGLMEGVPSYRGKP